MSREKRSNLAIFTLAGSILISSVVVSINQVNAHSTSATKREFIALKQCIANFQRDTAQLHEVMQTLREVGEDSPILQKRPPFADYLSFQTDEEGKIYWRPDFSTYNGELAWIADGLEC